MGKRLLSAGIVAALALFAVPGIASAHVLKVDGDIGAVLHINPDDNPTTGGSTDYVLSLSDDSGRFSLPKCDCLVSIIRNGKIVATKPLSDTDEETSDNHYTFTEPAVYDMRFTGSPKQSGAFQSFRLDYQVRVTSGNATRQSFPALLAVGMGLGIGLILLAAYAMDYTDK